MRIGHNSGGLDITMTGAELKALAADRVDVRVDVHNKLPASEWVMLTGSADGQLIVGRRRDGVPFVRYRFPKGSIQPPLFPVEDVKCTITDGVIYGAKPKMASPSHVVKRVLKPGAPSARNHLHDIGKVGESVRCINSFVLENPDRAKVWLDDEGMLHMSFTQTYTFS